MIDSNRHPTPTDCGDDVANGIRNNIKMCIIDAKPKNLCNKNEHIRKVIGKSALRL